MGAKSQEPLFGEATPKDRLLSRVLGELSKEEQIKKLTDLILAQSDRKEITEMIDVIKMIFNAHMDRDASQAYRCHLRKLYGQLPSAFAAPELKIKILQEILCGWRWMQGFDPDHTNEETEESEVCFRFVCEVYKTVKARRPAGMKAFLNEVDNLFRNRLEDIYVNWKTAVNFDQWILRDDVPASIALRLMKARNRFGGFRLGKSELTFLAVFDFHQRSDKARQMIMEQMAAIRKTEEVVKQLIDKIQPKDRWGDPIKNAIVQHVTIKFELENEHVVRLQVFVSRGHWDTDDSKCPKITADIQKARDELLEGIENPPRILLEIHGPEKYLYKE